MGIEGNFLNLIKDIYKKIIHAPTHQDQEQHKGVSFLFNIVLEVLASALRKEKEIKRIKIGKEDKLSLFTGNIIVYQKKSMESIKSY